MKYSATECRLFDKDSYLMSSINAVMSSMDLCYIAESQWIITARLYK